MENLFVPMGSPSLTYEQVTIHLHWMDRTVYAKNFHLEC